MKHRRFRLNKTNIPGIYKSDILFSENGNQYFVYIDRNSGVFEIYRANGWKLIFRSKKITGFDWRQRLLKRELKRLGVDFWRK